MIATIVRTIGKRTGYVVLGCVTGPGAARPCSRSARSPTVNGLNTLMWALEADTLAYGEWRTGNRTEGTTYVALFTREMGHAVGGFIGDLALTWAGFSAARASAGDALPAEIAQSIQLWSGGILGASSSPSLSWCSIR